MHSLFLIYIMLHQSVNSKSSKVNARSKNNQLIFAISMIALQIIITILYGIYGGTPIQQINIGSVLTTIFLFFLVVVGFGLFFGILKNLVWNGLGFSLLITALSIQLYPLINALWSKASIHTNGLVADSFSIKGFNVYLGNEDSIKYQNNTISAAVKCALALIIAFSSVMGRIGPLECLIMSVVGTLGYELNRSINNNFGQDTFGTFSVFTFGGFLGITLGLFMTARQRKNNIITHGNDQLIGSQITAVTSLIGGIFIFVLFPFFAYQRDQSMQASLFHRYITPVSIFLSMGSSVTTSIAISMLINGDNYKCIYVKNIINAVVAGGIAVGAASFYITAPYLALIVGVFSGISQYVFDNWLENLIYQKVGLISTHSFTLFCFQGFIGAIFAAAYNGRVTNVNMTNQFIFNDNLKSYGQQFAIYFISSAFGIACGIITGFPCYFINNYSNKELFHDRTEFKPNDGIRYLIDKTAVGEQLKINIQLNPINPAQIQDPNKDSNILHDKLPDNLPNDPEPTDYSEDEFSFDFADMLQVVVQ